MSGRPVGSGATALFLYFREGGGHRQACRALAAAWSARHPGWRTEEIDATEFMPRWERAFWLGLHRGVLRYCPALWRAYYRYTDRPEEPRFIRNRVSDAGSRAFASLLEKMRPRLVASTTGGAAMLAGAARARLGAPRVPPFLNAVVITDFRAHRHYARRVADLIFAPSSEAKEDVVRCGIPAERILVTGTPIRAGLRPLGADERVALRSRLGLSDRPMVLVSSGGTGLFWELDCVLACLERVGRPIDVVTCSGEAAPTRTSGRLRLLRLGYRPDYGEWLSAADLLVGKPGGITSMEALAVGLPIVAYAPIPGQEEHNAEYLVACGAAVWPRGRPALAHVLRRLLGDRGPADRARMAQAALLHARPDAAADVVDALSRALKRPR